MFRTIKFVYVLRHTLDDVHDYADDVERDKDSDDNEEDDDSAQSMMSWKSIW